MKKIWNRITFFFWWHFRATGMEKMQYDMMWRGMAIGKMNDQIKDNIERISPSMFFIDPEKRNKK